MFGIFKKKNKNPFDFDDNIQSPIDMYLSLVCHCAKGFLELTELDIKNIRNCEVAMGFMIFVMAHKTDMKYEHVISIIKRFQENMYKNKFSANEINDFSQKADFYYRKIAEALKEFATDTNNNILSLTSYIKLVFNLETIEPEEYMDYYMRATISMKMMASFLEADKKIKEDFKNGRLLW